MQGHTYTRKPSGAGASVAPAAPPGDSLYCEASRMEGSCPGRTRQLGEQAAVSGLPSTSHARPDSEGGREGSDSFYCGASGEELTKEAQRLYLKLVKRNLIKEPTTGVRGTRMGDSPYADRPTATGTAQAESSRTSAPTCDKCGKTLALELPRCGTCVFRFGWPNPKRAA